MISNQLLWNSFWKQTPYLNEERTYNIYKNRCFLCSEIMLDSFFYFYAGTWDKPLSSFPMRSEIHGLRTHFCSEKLMSVKTLPSTVGKFDWLNSQIFVFSSRILLDSFSKWAMVLSLGHKAATLTKAESSEVVVILYLSVYFVEKKKILSFSVLPLIFNVDSRDKNSI